MNIEIARLNDGIRWDEVTVLDKAGVIYFLALKEPLGG